MIDPTVHPGEPTRYPTDTEVRSYADIAGRGRRLTPEARELIARAYRDGHAEGYFWGHNDGFTEGYRNA